MANLIGQSLGRYHILEQLGEGGMATVYKAYDTRLESDVAVKVIRTENLAPNILERALKRFEREAKALARLTHANIVKVLDYGEYEGSPYLVMPYLEGGTLKERLQGKPINYQDAAGLLIPIAKALAYAHRQGMVHRDVKPSNILITESGDPMLTDFGIAKIIDSDVTQDLTGTSAAVGTPEYMAPEQATARSVDNRADIYALGIVFYEMVTGRKPYTADTPMAVLIKQATEPLPRPKHYVSSLPDSVERVLLKALAKDLGDRYQSMEEVVSALEALEARTGAHPEPEVRPTPPLVREKITLPQWKIPSLVDKRKFLRYLLAIIGGILLGSLIFTGYRFWNNKETIVELTEGLEVSTPAPVTASQIFLFDPGYPIEPIKAASAGNLKKLAQYGDGRIGYRRFSDDNRWLIVGGSHGFTIFDLPASRQQRVETDVSAYYIYLSGDSATAFIRSNNYPYQVDAWRLTDGEHLNTFTKPQGDYETYTYSDNYEYYAAAFKNDHAINIWSTATGQVIQKIPGQDSDIKSIEFSDENDTLLVSTVGEIQAWDLASGSLDRRYYFDQADTTCYFLDLTDNKKYLIARCHDYHFVWDYSSGSLQYEGKSPSSAYTTNLSVDKIVTFGFGFSSDYTYRLVFSDIGFEYIERSSVVRAVVREDRVFLLLQNGNVEMYNSTSTHPYITFTPYSSSDLHAWRMSYLDDIGAFVTYDDTELNFWRIDQSGVPQFTLIRSFSVSEKERPSFTVSEDGAWIAIGTGDGTVTLWKIPLDITLGWELLHTFEGLGEGAVDIEFSKDVRSLYISKPDGTIEEWGPNADSGTWELHWTSQEKMDSSSYLYFTEDRNYMYAYTDNDAAYLEICAWKVQGNMLIGCADGSHFVYAFAFQPGKQTMLLGVDGWLWSVNFPEGVIDKEVETEYSKILLSDNGQLAALEYGAAITPPRNIFEIWSLNQSPSSPIVIPRALDYYDETLASLSPDGEFLLTKQNGQDDAPDTVRAYATADGNMLYKLSFENISDVIFSSDGSIFSARAKLVGSEDYRLMFWSASTGTLLNSCPDNYPSTPYAISPDGRQLTTEDQDMISIWSIPTCQKLTSFDEVERLNLREIKFSLDGTLVAASDYDDKLLLFRVSDGRLVKTIDNLEDRVNGMTFSPNGEILAAYISTDNGTPDSYTIKLWDVSDSTSQNFGNLLSSQKWHTEDIVNIAFSPDGKLLVSGSEDGTVVIWGIPPQ